MRTPEEIEAFCLEMAQQLSDGYDYENLPVEDWVHGSGAYKKVVRYIRSGKEQNEPGAKR